MSLEFTPEFFKKHLGNVSPEEIGFLVRITNEEIKRQISDEDRLTYLNGEVSKSAEKLKSKSFNLLHKYSYLSGYEAGCVETKAEMLKDAVVVYGLKGSSGFSKTQYASHDIKGLIINIEEIKKEPCKHEKKSWTVDKEGNAYGECKHCGVELVAEWREK